MQHCMALVSVLFLQALLFGCAKGPSPEEATQQITTWLSDYFEVQQIEITGIRLEEDRANIRARAVIALASSFGTFSSELFGIEVVRQEILRGQTRDIATTKELLFVFGTYDTGWRIDKGPFSNEQEAMLVAERALESVDIRGTIGQVECDIILIRQALALFEIDNATYKVGQGKYSGAEGYDIFRGKVIDPDGNAYLVLPDGSSFTSFSYTGGPNSFSIKVRPLHAPNTVVYGTPERTWHE